MTSVSRASKHVIACISRAPFALATVAAVTACGGAGGNGSRPATATPHTPHASSSATAQSRISVGSVVFSSTLQPPSTDFGTGNGVQQGPNGITLSVDRPAGGYAFSAPKDAQHIPQDLALRVKAYETAPSDIYFGVACRGGGTDNTYLLLTDAKGDWVIVRVRYGNQTVLASGSDASVDGGKGVTLDVACVTPQSNDRVNRLILALDGKEVGSADDPNHNVAISNSLSLFAISPQSDTGTGSATFSDVSVRRATSP
jgi:hypothetical protein